VEIKPFGNIAPGNLEEYYDGKVTVGGNLVEIDLNFESESIDKSARSGRMVVDVASRPQTAERRYLLNICYTFSPSRLGSSFLFSLISSSIVRRVFRSAASRPSMAVRWLSTER
jgi:hypothetical protein